MATTGITIRGFRPSQSLSFLTDSVALSSAEEACAAESSAQETLPRPTPPPWWGVGWEVCWWLRADSKLNPDHGCNW